MVLTAAGATYLGGGATAPLPAPTIRQLTFRQGTIGQARFASDNEVVVCGASWDGEPYRLFTTRYDGYESRPLDLPPADLLALARDNTLALALSRPAVGGFLPRGPLAEVVLAGGAPRVRDSSVVAADFGPDGEIAAIVRVVDGVTQLEFPPGSIVEHGGVITYPRVSPDGNHVCFGRDWADLKVATRGTAAEVVIAGVRRVTGCAWRPGGDELWFTYAPTGGTHASVEAISLSSRARRTLLPFTGFAILHDVRPDGTALVSSGAMRFAARGGQPGAPELDLSVFDASRVAFMSASATELLVMENSTGAQDGGLFLKPLDGSPPVQLGAAQPLAMTAAGDWIAVLGDGRSQLSASDTLTLLPTAGGTARSVRLPVLLRHDNVNDFGTNVPEFRTAEFSDDGRRLLLPFAEAPGAAPRVYVHDFEAGWTKPITPEGVVGPAALSADGRFVASNQADGLFIYDVDSDERRAVPGGPDLLPGAVGRFRSAALLHRAIRHDSPHRGARPRRGRAARDR